MIVGYVLPGEKVVFQCFGFPMCGRAFCGVDIGAFVDDASCFR